MRRLAQPGTVVGEQRPVDQLGHGGRTRNGAGIDLRPPEEPLHPTHAVFRTISQRNFKSGRCLTAKARASTQTGVRALAVALATVGGVGYVPIASGTAGSLVALPLLPFLAALRDRAPVAYAALVLGLIAVAVWAAGRAEDVFGGEDHPYIVIDEVAGLVVAGALLPATWLAAVVAFVLFRVFDVVKPFPARQIDGGVEGGLGVVGDDLVAGLYAGLVTRLCLRIVA
ncbi:MAG: phosphatidylglycerophosphatase A [Deltaproteobacteria bacterium]|nr:MAG: phosphatidylglycerophosphatase A [Deltaproteobacteria bacterium]